MPGSTNGAPNDYTTSCGGDGPEAMYSIEVPAGHTLRIHQSWNDYDSRHELRWGGECPGEHVVDCTDDPDEHWHEWHNDHTEPHSGFEFPQLSEHRVGE